MFTREVMKCNREKIKNKGRQSRFVVFNSVKWLILSLLLLFSGCASVQVPMNDGPDAFPSVIQWSNYGKNTYNRGPYEWLEEAKKQFKNPVIFSCHGTVRIKTTTEKDKTVSSLVWYISPDPPRKSMPVQEVADMLVNLYPDRDIILTVCNPQGLPIKAKKVHYAKSLVWVVPDNYEDFPINILRHIKDKECVGNLKYFVETP